MIKKELKLELDRKLKAVNILRWLAEENDLEEFFNRVLKGNKITIDDSPSDKINIKELTNLTSSIQ